MRAIISAGLVALLPVPAPAQTKPVKAPEKTVEPRKWEHDTSDLKPDPRFHFGALKNGFRYVWMNNTEPKKQVFLRLHVNLGSLVETDAEQGMAHFVEHMAFNGTTNFKAGTLVATFNNEGIKFGHDVNAHTGMEETVYELDLPDTEPERMKKSLQWFRDVACGLKMEDKEVQAEKGVIDAEERDRGGEGFQTFVELLTKALDGTLVPKRLPIGVKSVRDKFNSKTCLGFYKKWYRPEHMTFVLVGDLGALDPTQMITDSFGTMPVPKDPLPARPDLGKPSFKNKGFALSRSIFRSMFGPGGPAIVVASLRPGAPKPFSSEGLGTEIQGELLDLLAGQRFAERDDKDKLPYDAINVLESSSIVDSQGTVEGPALVVHCDKDHWRDALTGAERELRRMTEKGFTDDELKKAYFQHQKTLTPRPEFPPPHSLEFVQSLLQACNGGYVPMKDRDEKDARRVASRKFNDVKAMNQSFKDLWTKGELVIFSSGLELGADPAADLLATWEAAKATSLDQPMPVSTDATAKADKPADGAEPGAAPDADTAAADKDKKEPAKKADPKAFAYAVPDVVKDATATANRMDDLKVVDLAFQNGVKATYRKKMDEGNFSFGRFEVRVGEGMLALDPSKRAVAAVATRVFLPSGLAKNDWDTVNAAGGGAVHFEVEGDALVFSGVALGSDPKRAFEVICAYLTDPGWRQDAFDEFKKKLPEEFKKEGEAKENLNTLLSKFRDQLVSAEPRLADPDQAALEAVTFDEVKSFLQSQLDGPVAVTAVGIDGAKFERGVFSTFAKLPKRRAAQSYDARRAIAPLKTGLKEKHDVETGQQSALIHMIYPATDAIDPAASRRLELLEDIVMDRLRIEIREKRAGAYSPNANVWGSDTWKGLGWVALDVQVDPAKVDEMIKACALTMETLGTKGVTQPELDRLRTAHLGDYEQSLKEDGLWFHAMQEGHARPEVYDELRNFKAPYEKITVADMNALCKAVFVKGHEDVFVAIPKK